MDPEIAISVRDVAKKFRLFSSPHERLVEALHPFRRQLHKEFWALHGVDFAVYRGEIVGIMGRNGSGKSTLLQIICSVMQPTRGEVEVNGRISALLELGAGFNPNFTGRENVVLNGAIMGFSRQEMLERLPQIEAFADIGEFFDQPVKTYSSGMYVRVAFAAAIHVDPEILIVDEALSVGDTRFQHRCYQRIREFMEQGKTILVVSHSTDALLRVCQRGIVIEGGHLKYIGAIKEAVDRYHEILFGNSAGRMASSDTVAENPVTKDDGGIPTILGSLDPSDTMDRIGQKSTYNQHETRLGNRSVSIINFDLVVDGVANPPEIPCHAPVDVYVKVLFNETVDHVEFGFAILSVEGTYLFGTNSTMRGEPILHGSAGDSVVVKLRWTPNFVGAEYFLSLGCYKSVGGETMLLDARRSVACITFSATPSSMGFVECPVEVVGVEKLSCAATGLAVASH